MTPARFRAARRRLVAAHLALVAIWSIVIPMFEKPDEPGHFEYARFVVRERRLPRPLPAFPWVECAWEFHHPPLYPLIAGTVLALADPALAPEIRTDRLRNTFFADPAAARTAAASPDVPRLNARGPLFHGPDAGFFVREPRDAFPWSGPFRSLHLIRLLGLPIGAGLVLATARAAAVVLGAGPWALAATALVAFNPQVVFLLGSVSNDGLAALLGSLVSAAGLTVALTPSPLPLVAALGLTLGAALLTRLTLLGLVPFALACAWCSRPGRPWPRVALCAAVAASVCGGWFIRNQALYGDPLARRVTLLANAGLEHVRGLRDPFFWAPIEGGFGSRTFQSYWGFFGWMSLPQSRRIAVQLALLCGVGAAGALAAWWGDRSARSAASARARRGIALCALAVLGSVALVVQLNRTFDSPQGRYLFGTLAPCAVLVAAGWRRWCGPSRSPLTDVALLRLLPIYLLAVNVVDLVKIARTYMGSATG